MLCCPLAAIPPLPWPVAADPVIGDCGAAPAAGCGDAALAGVPVYCGVSVDDAAALGGRVLGRGRSVRVRGVRSGFAFRSTLGSTSTMSTTSSSKAPYLCVCVCV